jgi:NAD(P)-dependent dehydrogenase (short-subunit alcohol dehydrogenase family)
LRLLGKSAIVTGASRGIGRAIATIFAQQGANVLVNGRKEEELYATCVAISTTASGKVVPFIGDLGYKEQVDAMFDFALQEFGRLDVLVNNAAVAWSKHFLDYTEEWWDQIMQNNLKSVYLASHRAAQHMVTNRQGSIISLSSIGATKAHRESVAYDASKGAIDAFTRALALDLGPWNIRVNAISPAVIVGDHVRKLPDDVLSKGDPADFITPLSRQGTAEDVANLALFLASEQSSFITGQVIAIDGGLGIQARAYHDSPFAIPPRERDQSGG